MTRRGLERIEQAGEGGDFCVVGVELLLCGTIDLAQIPANARTSYVKQQIGTLAPFRRYEAHSEIGRDWAVVWIWDGTIAEETALQRRPEHLLFNPPVGSGRRAVERRVRDTWFLECWDGDQLIVCRRYLTTPSDGDKESLLIEFGLTGTASSFVAAESSYRRRLRGSVAPLSFGWFKRPIGVATICATVAAVALLVSTGRYVGWTGSILLKERALGTAVLELEPLLKLRAEALRLNTASMAIETWLRRPKVITVVADFETAVGSLYGELLEWSYDVDRLRAEVRSRDGRTRELIEALEASPRFSEVQALPGEQSDRIVIEADVLASVGA